MRASTAGLILLALGAVAPALAEDGSEEQQRCVSGCLYHSKGASDPAYERCVAKYCAHIGEDEDEDQPAKGARKK